MIFYFSGTGNSRWVAATLSHLLDGDRCISIADSMLQDVKCFTLKEGERLGFVFPVYGWNVPEIVEKFIEKLEFDGGKIPDYLYFVATCGDDTGRTLQMFRKLIGKHQWKLQSAYVVQMPNTYVCLHGFDVDKKNVVQRKYAAAKEYMPLIARKIMAKFRGEFKTRPGIFPRFKTYVLGRFFRRFLMSDKSFRVDDNICTGCGKCYKICPVKNITFEHKYPEWNGKCTACLACYHHCPQRAILYGRQTYGKGQYICYIN